jgi:hypothetical protein
MSETTPLSLLLSRAVELGLTGAYLDWDAVAAELVREGHSDALSVINQYGVRALLDRHLQEARRA